MPNPHFDVQIISRGNGKKGASRKGGRSAVAAAAYRSGTRLRSSREGGRSAIAAAAYRSGEPIYDQAEQKTYDYTRKEDVMHKEIMLPEDAPAWAKTLTREQLWNKVEAAENRKDAQLARDMIGSLARELTLEQQIAMVREFVRTNLTSRGMIADIAIHDKEAGDGGRQPHVHILVTLRELRSDGFDRRKNREWNNQNLVQVWRDSWEKLTNEALEAAGNPKRLDLKSNKERGINRSPQEYMGYEAMSLERRGIRTEKGNRNRRRKHLNSVRELLPPKRETESPDLDKETQSSPSLATAARDLKSGASGGGQAANMERHDRMIRQFLRNAMRRNASAHASLMQRVQRLVSEVGEGVTERFADWADGIGNRDAAKELERKTRQKEREYER